jgi:peptidoglycan/xylan/chitin deacetylase (PgdA/CDA1 family)
MTDASDTETTTGTDVPAPEFEGTFALCLTHDVDRPYKTYQSFFYALRERRPAHLESLLPRVNPYWRFEEIMALEEHLGVRSAFYFLDAKYLLSRSPREWISPFYWLEWLGGYDPTAPAIARIVRALDDGGWEVGLHGSYGTHCDPERLAAEKRKLEAILGHDPQGGRQHYLRLSDPPAETWGQYRDLGLSYDASLGSSTEYGFRHGYDLLAPFEDEFRVFPLTLMEVALENAPSAGDADPEGSSVRVGSDEKDGHRDGSRRGIDVEAAWRECERLLEEAAANEAVMTVLWHPRYFSTEDFPGYRELYRQLIERALSMGAWVGPPGDLYRTIDHDRVSEHDERRDVAGTTGRETGESR